MSNRDMSYSAWQRRRARARGSDLESALPPYRRERLRSHAEARVLRRLGTPEHLIGPVGTDDEVEAELNELIAFARRLRARTGGLETST